ncbi:MAG TPA: nucleotidyltransferase domain-containing protein [Solirubrobacterales bacterium]
MGAIQELAVELGAEERTLRRAVSQGALRCSRAGPRRLRLEVGEREYLEGHWELLAGLRRALRSERRVRLAVLYGSVARGDEDGGSDLDLMVSLRGDRPSDAFELATRLEPVAGRRVDVAHLQRIDARAPLLLERILDEGRVLVDRDGLWLGLRDRRRAIHARAMRAHRRQVAGARQAIAELSA